MRSLIVLLPLLAVALGAESRSGRIVGGWPVDIENRPFQVAILFVTLSGEFHHLCGGSLITSRHVLTAAHCFPGASLPDAPWMSPFRYIRAGSNLFNTGGVISRVAQVVSAPMFDPVTLRDDISVLAIETPIIANGHTIEYALIGHPDSVLSDGLASVASGWGETAHGGDVSVQLLEVEVFLINWQVCHDRYDDQDRFPPGWPPLRVTENMICAGMLDEGGAGVCRGDSGGPLTVQGAIYGVAAFNFICADDYFPDVYTAVQPYVSWIVETVASI